MTPTQAAVRPDDTPEPTYTGPVEDYLKTIPTNSSAPPAPRPLTDIAHWLAIAPASVTGMVAPPRGSAFVEARALPRRPPDAGRTTRRAPYAAPPPRDRDVSRARSGLSLGCRPRRTGPNASSTLRAMSWWTGWPPRSASRRSTRTAHRFRAATGRSMTSATHRSPIYRPGSARGSSVSAMMTRPGSAISRSWGSPLARRWSFWRARHSKARYLSASETAARRPTMPSESRSRAPCWSNPHDDDPDGCAGGHHDVGGAVHTLFDRSVSISRWSGSSSMRVTCFPVKMYRRR